MLWNGYLWESKAQIRWRRIKLIVTLLVVCCYAFCRCVYYDMSHFDKKEFQWAQPFIEQGNVNYFGSNGDTLQTVIRSKIRNQSKWWRIHFPSINELTPAYHARMLADYSFESCNHPETDWGLLWAYISKPISDDSVWGTLVGFR